LNEHSIFLEKTDKMQAHLDSFIVDGSDHELFIASYLHGHFDIAVAAVEKLIEDGNQNPLLSLKETLEWQLEKAFQNNELNQQDAEQVTQLFAELFKL
jgi:hypothetical protein